MAAVFFDPTDPNSETTNLPTTPPVQDGQPPTATEQAQPMPPGAPPQGAAPPQINHAAAVSQPQAFDVFKDPKFLTQAAGIFLQNGDEMGLKWLEHAHNAVNENAVSAAQALLAGDGDRAVQLWNMSGRHQNAVSALQNPDGTWKIDLNNGSSVQIDPKAEIESLMSPDAYAKVQAEKQKNAIDQQHVTGLNEYYKGMVADRAEATAARERAAIDSAALKEHIANLQNDVATAKTETARADAQRKLDLAEAASKAAPKMRYDDLTKQIMASNPGTDPAVARAQALDAVSREYTESGVQEMPDGTFAVRTKGIDGKPQIVAGGYGSAQEAATAANEYRNGNKPIAAPKPIQKTAPAKTNPAPAAASPVAGGIPAAAAPAPDFETAKTAKLASLKAVEDRKSSPQYQNLEAERVKALRAGKTALANNIIAQQQALLNGDTGM